MVEGTERYCWQHREIETATEPGVPNADSDDPSQLATRVPRALGRIAGIVKALAVGVAGNAIYDAASNHSRKTPEPSDPKEMEAERETRVIRQLEKYGVRILDKQNGKYLVIIPRLPNEKKGVSDTVGLNQTLENLETLLQQMRERKP